MTAKGPFVPTAAAERPLLEGPTGVAGRRLHRLLSLSVAGSPRAERLVSARWATSPTGIRVTPPWRSNSGSGMPTEIRDDRPRRTGPFARVPRHRAGLDWRCGWSGNAFSPSKEGA